MADNQEPAGKNGKICYIEIPAVDVNASIAFYQKSFAWNIRKRGDGHMAFDDTTGQVSGAWVKGRIPMTEAGLMIYIMVDNIEKAVELVKLNGGKIIQPIGVDAPELTARFTDPAGNIIGLYEEPRK
ncbi:MAG: VOC family protein [Chitinophagales bacterium]